MGGGWEAGGGKLLRKQTCCCWDSPPALLMSAGGQAPQNTLAACRIQRDISCRGRDVAGVLHQYTRFVKPAFQQFVAPSRKHADIIVPWTGCGPAALALRRVGACFLAAGAAAAASGEGQDRNRAPSTLCRAMPASSIPIACRPVRREGNSVAIHLITEHIRTKLQQHDLRRVYTNLELIPSTYQVGLCGGRGEEG